MLNIITEFIKEHDDKNNYISGKDFEDNLRLKLKNNNIIEIQGTKGTKKFKKIYEDNKKKLREYIEELKNNNIEKEYIENKFLSYFQNNTFLYQPFGSQKFPDFILFENNKIILIEFKWSKNKNIAFNDSLPFYYAFYFFATPDNLFLFQGKDLISFDLYILLNNKVKLLREESKKKKKNLGIYIGDQNLNLHLLMKNIG